MAKDRDAIVVGAGVIGSAVAYFLQEAGLSVCLIDRGAVAAGTTSASAGHTSVQGRVPGPALDLALANVRLLGEPKRALPDDFEYVQSGGLILPFADHGLEAPPEVEGELQKKRYLKQTGAGGFQGRFYVGSTSEFRGFDRSSSWEGVSQLCQYAIDTVPALARARLVRGWAGLRPRSRDGTFIIGEAPGCPGFWLATGHDSIGILYSAMTGRLLSQWIRTGERPALLAMFDPARPSLAAAAP